MTNFVVPCMYDMPKQIAFSSFETYSLDNKLIQSKLMFS